VVPRKRKSKKNKKKVSIKLWKLIAFILLVSIICISATKLFYESHSIVEVRKLPVKVIVMDRVGLGLQEDVLSFGGVSPGGTSRRQMIIASYHDEPLIVSIKFNGDVSRWVQVEENDFRLEKDEEKRIEFSVYIPLETKKGEYEGEVIVIFKKAA